MSNWLVDPGTFNIDCGDNSCLYAPKKKGMRTNGGCRCVENNGRRVEFFLRQNYHTALRRIEELEKEIQATAERDAGVSI